MSRSLLHKSKIGDFKTWLTKRGITWRPGRGNYQVIQVLTTKHGWQVVYDRESAPEHYTVTWPLEMTVKRFINDSTQRNDQST